MAGGAGGWVAAGGRGTVRGARGGGDLAAGGPGRCRGRRGYSVPGRVAPVPGFVARQQVGLAADDQGQEFIGKIAVLSVLDGEGDAVKVGHGVSFLVI